MKSIFLAAATLAAMLTSPALAASTHVAAGPTASTDPDPAVRLSLRRELFAGGAGYAAAPATTQPSRTARDRDSVRGGYAFVPAPGFAFVLAPAANDANVQLELRREKYN